MNRVYLDYAATTPIDSRVERAMRPYFADKFGNPGSLHSFGQEAIRAVDEARKKIATTLGSKFREIVFTGSATEANNLALRGAINATRLFFRGTGGSRSLAARDRLHSRQSNFALSDSQASIASESYHSRITEPIRIITSSVEHESVLQTVRELEKEGVEVVFLPVNKEGLVDLDKLEESLDERTALVSIMYANNEVGSIEPIWDIAEAVRRFRRARKTIYPLFHTDGAQALQFLDCDVNKLGVDLATFSAHKIYGPKGIGCLYAREGASDARGNSVRRPVPCVLPIIMGGGQEFGLRSGTENVPAIVGFGEAANLVSKEKRRQFVGIGKLRDGLWKGIAKICPTARLNGGLGAGFLPNILNVYFPGCSAEELLTALDLRGVAAASGSACSARAPEPSHVIQALGWDRKRASGSVRFSLGRLTTTAEVQRTLRILESIFKVRN